MNGLQYNISVWGLEKSGKEQIIDYLNNYECLVYDFSYPEIEMNDKGYDILVLRDIWNWMADYIISDNNEETLDTYNPQYKDDPYAYLINGSRYLDVKYLFPIYHKHAELFLNPPKNLITISFNKWLVDEEYRKQIIYKLGFKYIGIEIEQMNMLNRWEKFEHSTSFWENLLNCSYTNHLSKQIFGRVKRTQI